MRKTVSALAADAARSNELPPVLAFVDEEARLAAQAKHRPLSRVLDLHDGEGAQVVVERLALLVLWPLKIEAGARAVVPVGRAGKAAAGVHAGERRMGDEDDGELLPDRQLLEQHDEAAHVAAAVFLAAEQVGQRVEDDEARLEPFDDPDEGVPERRGGDSPELRRGGGETGVAVGERQDVEIGAMREALAFRLEDCAQIQVHVLAVVLRSDEQHRPLSHLHAEPVAVGAHGYGKLKGERGLADPAVAGQQRQRLVGDDVLDDPLPLRLGVVGQGRCFDDAPREVAFFAVNVVVSRGVFGDGPGSSGSSGGGARCSAGGGVYFLVTKGAPSSFMTRP